MIKRQVSVDLMLQDISGEKICKIIRETSDVHIFMLTAKGTLNEKIDGLNMGADEYLVKPFSPRVQIWWRKYLFLHIVFIRLDYYVFVNLNYIERSCDKMKKTNNILSLIVSSVFT